MNLRDQLRQFLKFGVVGTIGAVVDFGTYGIMTRILQWDTVLCLGISGGTTTYTTTIEALGMCTTPHYPLVPANMVSVFLAIVSNFFFNKFWTFRDTQTRNIAAQGAGYFLMNLITWTLNQVLTGFFASRLVILHAVFGPLTDVAAKVLAVAIVLFFNYGGSKFIIFRRARAGSSSRARR